MTRDRRSVDGPGVPISGLRPGRRPWGMVAAGALALIVAVAPASATTLKPAFKGVDTMSYTNIYSGCSAKSTIAKKPVFSLRTGKGAFDGAGKVSSCLGAGANTVTGQVYQDVGPLAEIPISLPKGSDSIEVNMSASFTQYGNVTYLPSTPCTDTSSYSYYYNSTYFYNYTYGFCEIFAETEFWAGSYLYDATNQSWIYASGGSANFGSANFYSLNYAENYSYIYYGCYDFSFSFPYCFSYNYSFTTSTLNWTGSQSGYGDEWINLTGVHSNHYVLLVEATALVYAYVTDFARSSASASLNAGTNGNGYSLNWISVN